MKDEPFVETVTTVDPDTGEKRSRKLTASQAAVEAAKRLAAPPTTGATNAIPVLRVIGGAGNRSIQR